MSIYATVPVRAITFAEIQALAQRDATPVQVYLSEPSLQHGVTVTPATLTPSPRTGKAYHDAEVPHEVVHACVEDTSPNTERRWKADPDVEVGHVVSGEIVTLFGTQTGVHLFTTPEAEHTALMVRGWTDPTQGRRRIHVPDAEAGREERLTPVYGAQVSTGFVITGVDAEEARERAEAALAAEFGDALRPQFKVQSRPVADKRVNVYNASRTELWAANVLSAEVPYYIRSGACHVEEVDPAAPPIVVGD